MPDRHRHDEFIWALIFSLIINLLFVFALLAPRYVKKSSGLRPFVISITASQRALPAESPAIPGATAIPAPAKRKKKVTPTAPILPQSPNVKPALPSQDNDRVEAISPLAGKAEAATDLSPLATAGESATATSASEIAGGLSILGDKITGDNYTAPEYLVGEKPPYPKRAEQNGWEGTVLLSLSINVNGEVERVGIAKSSGYELLDYQARKSVGAWRFKPARRNGLAIAVTVQQPIIFRPTPPGTVQ